MWDFLNIKGLTAMEQGLLYFVIALGAYIAYLVRNMVKMTKDFMKSEAKHSELVKEQNMRIEYLERCCDTVRNNIQ